MIGLALFLLIISAFVLVRFMAVMIGQQLRDQFRQQLATELSGTWSGDTLVCEVEGSQCTCTISASTIKISIPSVGESPQLVLRRSYDAKDPATRSKLYRRLAPNTNEVHPRAEALHVLRPEIRAKLAEVTQSSLALQYYRWSCDNLTVVYQTDRATHHKSEWIINAIRAAVSLQDAMHAPRVTWQQRCEEEAAEPDIQLAVYDTTAKVLDSSEIRQVAELLAPDASPRVALRMLDNLSDDVANSVAFQIVANAAASDSLRVSALNMLRKRELSYRERAIPVALVHGGAELIEHVARMLERSCSYERLGFVREYVDRMGEQAAAPILRVLALYATEEDEDRLLSATRDNRFEVFSVVTRALGRMGSARCVGPLTAAMTDRSTSRQAKHSLKGAIAQIQERVGAVAGGLAVAETAGVKGGLAMTASASVDIEVESVAVEAESAEEQK